MEINDFLKNYSVHDSTVTELDVSAGLLTFAIELACFDNERSVVNLRFGVLSDTNDVNIEKIRTCLQNGGDVGLLKFSCVTMMDHFNSWLFFELMDYHTRIRSYVEVSLESKTVNVFFVNTKPV